MMANSAVSDKVKRSTMTNEALRRLWCCSSNLEEYKKVEVMENYARLLKRSGYSERFRHEVISDAIRGHQKVLQEASEGRRPMNRPRGFQEEERRRKRQEKGERRDGTGGRRGAQKMREGVFIIPPTPESVLAKTFKKVCQGELKGTNILMAVTERGGRRLGGTHQRCWNQNTSPDGFPSWKGPGETSAGQINNIDEASCKPGNIWQGLQILQQ